MKTLRIMGLATVILAMFGGLYAWWQHGKTFPGTDDATLEANLVTIAPQIGGRVISVLAIENGHVAADDLLFSIDAAPFQAAVDRALADLDRARLIAGSAGADVSGAGATVAAAAAALRQAREDLARDRSLARGGQISQMVVDRAQTAVDQAVAAKALADAALSAAAALAGRSVTGDTPGIRSAQSALALARIDLAHCSVTAPAAGWIANISLRPGQIVTANEPLFALVEDGAWWVDGNFKETDLQRIRPGQPVALKIDMYAGMKLSGTVESIGTGSGAVFSLLPSQNATGNWVKVTQRFAVRIAIDPASTDPDRPLRVGASVTATVDTTDPVTK
jgi:membrane fusion protein (multidrug efflux system)